MSTTRDPTDLAGQEQDELRANALLSKARTAELDDLRWLMSHAQGRRIVWRMLEKAEVYASCFNHSGSVMAWKEGKRDMGLFLLAEVEEAAPGGYLKMLGERPK
jgi:hypothetical protein